MELVNSLDAAPFFELYKSLPINQQKLLKHQAQTLLARFDRALTQVLSPVISKTEHEYIVSDEVIPLYGVGITPQDAMTDYRSVVAEYYYGLEQDEHLLAPQLKKQLDLLRHLFSLVEEI